MSRRYGRKQKRQARAHISLLEKELGAMRYQLQDERRGNDAMRDQLARLWLQIENWDADVRNLLGRYSAFLFDAGRIKGTADSPRQLACRGWSVDLMPLKLSPNVCDVDLTMDFIERIKHFRMLIKDIPRPERRHLQKLLRLEVVEMDDAAVHYGLSEEMLHKGLLSEVDIWRIATDMARLMVEQLNKPPKRR